MYGPVQRKVLAIMILAISIFSMIPNSVDATSYEKTYYNLVYTASTSIDDAYYLIGYEFSNNSTLGYLKSSSYDNYAGFRFQDIVIPVGAVLDSAYISLYGSDAIDGNSYFTTIKGIGDANASGFSTFADLLNANLLSSYVNWNMKDLEGGVWRNTTNIKIILDDILQHTGWVSGDNIAFRFDSAQSSSGTRSFKTYDYGINQYAPKIYITYHTLTPITENNPPDVIDDLIGDTKTIVDNNTEGYTLWKISNETCSRAIRFYGLNSSTSSYFYNSSLSTIDAYYSCGDDIHKYNNSLYVALFGANYIYIYKSDDAGVSWSFLKSLNFGSGMYNMAIDIDDNGIMYIGFVTIYSASFQRWYFVDYNIGTNTFGTIYTMAVSGTSSNGKFAVGVWTSQDGTIQYYWGNPLEGAVAYRRDGVADTTLTSFTMYAPSGSIRYVDADNYYDVSTGTHYLYMIIYKYSVTAGNNFIYGEMLWSNDTVGTLETILSGSTSEGGYRVKFNTDEPSYIQVAYARNGYLYTRYENRGLGGTHVWTSGVLTVYDSGATQIIYFTLMAFHSRFYIAYRTTTGTGIFESTSLGGSAWSPIGQKIYGATGNLVIKTAYNIFTYYFEVAETSTIYVVVDDDGNWIWSGPDPPPWFHTIPEISLSINGKSNGTYWLFKGEVYNLTAVMNNTDIAAFNFTDGVHTMLFYYNNFTKSQRLYVYNATGTLVNENVVTGISTSKSYNETETTISYKFILNLNIVDSQNKTVYYELSYCNSTTYSPLIVVSNPSDLSFNIYNLGGLVSYVLSGDGNRVSGGSPFEIYATNSSLVNGTMAYSEMIYRRLQSVHMLVELNTDNKIEADHLEPLVNVGYYEVGFDYKLDGHEEDEWLTGWSARVYISEINVGTYGASSDSAYTALTVLWYNRGDFVRGDQYLYSYHWGYDKTAFPTHRESITFWADLWFDKANSSTVFGGRINTEYYGYYEDGSSWWFGYGGFRPLMGNVTASMVFGNVIDDDGNILSSKNIGLVRVWEKVAKTASAGDADTYTVKPFQVFSLKVAQDRMDGIDTPVFIEPKQLNLGGYSIFDPLLGAFGGIGSVISGALFGMGKVMIGGIDTILSWVGLPYGTFSGFVNFVMIIFTSLIGSMANVISMISKSLTLITTFLTTIITFVDYIISIILFFGVDIFSIPLQIIALFIAVLNGGIINFYGITLDFTPYAQLMVALKTLLPPMGGIMLTVWIFWGNLSMSGEPDIMGAMQRIVQLFGMMRNLYTNIMWIFIRIRNELISIYNFLKSHIPGMGGGGGTIEEGGA